MRFVRAAVGGAIVAIVLPGCGGDDGAAPVAHARTERRALAAGDTIDITQLMNWAEAKYPQYFPGPAGNERSAPYTYRFYPATGNYVGGDANGVVYLFGPVAGGRLVPVGTLGDFACDVLIETCQAPSILAPPLGTAVAAGSRATLSAVVGGGPSLRLQWLRNGVPIAGAQGTSYTLVAAPADDGARFALRASNAKGTAVSEAAVLGVLTGAAAALALVESSGCFVCHQIDASAQGPALRLVARRYAGFPDASSVLAARIRSGTSGNWGPFYMPAQALTAAEANTIVDWILGL